MGFFTKKEHTHVVRDEQGNVVRLERNLDEHGMKNVEQLEREYKETHPTRLQKMRENYNEKRFEHSMQRANEKQAYTKAYHKARIERHTEIGRQAGSRTGSDRLERLIMGPPRRRQPYIPRMRSVAPPRYNPPKGRSHPRHKKRKNINNAFRPMKFDIFDNWGLLK